MAGEDISATLSWQETTDSGYFDHFVTFRPRFETEGERRLPSTLLPRWLCHVIVSRLPDEGLPELCDALAQMYEFYATKKPPAQRLLAEPVVAHVVQQQDRPDFFLTDEE